MPPHDREIGELLGEMRGEIKVLRDQIASSEIRNSEEHAAVMRRFDRFEGKLEGKVSRTWLDEQDLPRRVDSLEATRDEGKGKRWMVKVVEGIGLFIMALLGLLLGKGLHL